MGATADTIWQIPVYLPYLQPPLTEAAVAAAENQIGYRLPAEFLGLLKRQNGGYIRFGLPDMIHDKIAGIGPYFPSLIQFDWSEVQDRVSFRLQGLVPFDGDGHWFVCIDYREDEEAPSITYADVECDHQSTIANSFAGYLKMLRIDTRDKLVLPKVSDIQAVISSLSTALNASFFPPSATDHGYPEHRARLGSEVRPRWIWISPNTVPRGFVRPGDRRYAELKELMPGLGERFPELPAQSYLLSATDEIRTTAIDACVRCGMSIRPLSEYLSNVDS
jgi:hypothetical protein